MSIKDRHETWNGSPVPYGTSVEELRERILRRDSARWAALVALAHAPGENWAKLWDAWNEDPLPRHRAWACELAEAFGGKDVLARLRILREELDGHVRKAADEAIRRIEA